MVTGVVIGLDRVFVGSMVWTGLRLPAVDTRKQCRWTGGQWNRRGEVGQLTGAAEPVGFRIVEVAARYGVRRRASASAVGGGAQLGD